MNKNNRHPNDGKKPITIFGPDFPFAFDDWIEHPAGLGSIPADKLGSEVAIVGVNRMVERPVVIDGQIVVRKMMNLSSSFDHRVVDGMDAALFIQAVRGLLEQPACLFVE